MLCLLSVELQLQYFVANYWNTAHVLYMVSLRGIGRHSYEQEYAWHTTVHEHENYDICVRVTTTTMRHDGKESEQADVLVLCRTK